MGYAETLPNPQNPASTPQLRFQPFAKSPCYGSHLAVFGMHAADPVGFLAGDNLAVQGVSTTSRPREREIAPYMDSSPQNKEIRKKTPRGN